MVVSYDSSRDYRIDDSGTLFWSIFNYASNLLYIYPDFFKWFQSKVISGLSNNQRLIFATYNSRNSLTGYMVLKKTEKEHKICTLQVLPDFRNKSLGSQLLSISLSILKNPIITVSDHQLHLYQNLLSRYNFSLMDIVSGYSDNSKEYIFQYRG